MRSNSFKNHILSAISLEDWNGERNTLFSDLEPVKLAQRQVLYEAGAALDLIYFPESGVGSVLTIMEDGSSVEVGMIGREGLIGISALLGGRRAIQHIVVQIPGEAWRMSVASAQTVFNRSLTVRFAVNRFVDSFLNVSAQTAACNRVHSIEQRCARWLLMARDRIDTDEMPMTHDFLSSMLGVRRTGVTEIAAKLREKGLINYRHGHLQILDYEGLIAVACECYLIDHRRLDNGR